MPLAESPPDEPAEGGPLAPARKAVNRSRGGRPGGEGPVRLLLMIAVAWGIYAVFFRDF